MYEIVHYQEPDGSFLFREWMARLRDKQAKARIAQRLSRLEEGNIGDSKPVGEGIVELRIHVGAGYRIYCGRYGESWIVLLCEATRAARLRTSSERRTTGRIGNGGSDEKARRSGLAS